MGLRKDFLAHRNKTMESFNLVSADISNINLNLVNLRTMLASVEDRISDFSGKIQKLNDTLDKCGADISLQRSNEAVVTSTINDMNDSISEINESLKLHEKTLSGRLSSFEERLDDFASGSKVVSQKVASNTDSLKKLLPRSKSQSIQGKKMNSALKESQDSNRKLRNLLNRKIKSANRADAEFESKLRGQRRKMSQLNRKIELSAGRKVSVGRSARRTARKTTVKTSGRKVITKKITPKKTVTTIKTPKRTVTKTVTRRKTVTRKITPKRKEVYEVIKEKNPLI